MGQAAGLLAPGIQLAPGELAAEALPDRLVQHLRALRPRRGERYVFLDGRGTRWAATVRDDRPLRFEVGEAEVVPALEPKLVLCLAPPKGDDLWQSVTQATEVGAARIAFVRSEHAQIAKGQNVPIDRARRVSDASCEQCVRAWQVDIEDEWRSTAELLARPGVHVVADEGLAGANPIGFVEGVPPSLRGVPVHLYVGPEGGWSDAEREAFRGKAFPLSLGSLVMRVPTAVVAGLHFLRLVSEHGSAR